MDSEAARRNYIYKISAYLISAIFSAAFAAAFGKRENINSLRHRVV